MGFGKILGKRKEKMHDRVVMPCTFVDSIHACGVMPYRSCGSDRKSHLLCKWLFLVPEAGVEPARYRYHGILSPARLPIPSFRRTQSFYHIFWEKSSPF